jgi:hypothetical protein
MGMGEEAVGVLQADAGEGGEARLEWTGLGDYLAQAATA